MTRKLAVKLMIDLGLTVSMFLAFAYHLTGPVAHEFIGLVMFLLLLAHNSLNWRWYKNLGRPGGGLERRLTQAVTLVLLAVTVALLVSSILASRVLFDFVRVGNGFLVRQIHALVAYWILVLMSVHLGLHWPLVMAALRQALKLNKTGLWRSALMKLSALTVMGFGVWASFDRGLGSKLLMRHSFDYWDGGPAGFFITYLLIMGLYVGLIHYSLQFLRKLKKTAWTALLNRWPGGIMFKSLTMVMTVALCIFGFIKISEAQEMNKTLSAKQQAIVPIAAFTASGDLEKLKPALGDGLAAGLTVNEIKEVLVQLYAYAGFPRSLNALVVFMEVMKEREAQGIKDDPGPEAKPLPIDKTRLELGTANQATLSGGPVGGPLFEFAPAIDLFLKDHLFGDIFGRDNLDFQSREVATVAALASISEVNPQLQAHFNISLNVGLTGDQMTNLVEVLRSKVGAQIGDNAAEVLDAVLKNRK